MRQRLEKECDIFWRTHADAEGVLCDGREGLRMGDFLPAPRMRAEDTDDWQPMSRVEGCGRS